MGCVTGGIKPSFHRWAFALSVPIILLLPGVNAGEHISSVLFNLAPDVFPVEERYDRYDVLLSHALCDERFGKARSIAAKMMQLRASIAPNSHTEWFPGKLIRLGMYSAAREAVEGLPPLDEIPARRLFKTDSKGWQEYKTTVQASRAIDLASALIGLRHYDEALAVLQKAPFCAQTRTEGTVLFAMAHLGSGANQWAQGSLLMAGLPSFTTLYWPMTELKRGDQKSANSITQSLLTFWLDERNESEGIRYLEHAADIMKRDGFSEQSGQLQAAAENLKNR